MNDFHPDDYAVIVKLAPGGWDELQSGTAAQMIVELATGRHRQPGALGLLIDGRDTPIFGRALSELVAAI